MRLNLGRQKPSAQMLMAENRVYIYMRVRLGTFRMATEEPSVIAAASNGARMAAAEEAIDFNHGDGDACLDLGYWLNRFSGARQAILLYKDELTRMANDKNPCWISTEAGKGPGGPTIESRRTGSSVLFLVVALS